MTINEKIEKNRDEKTQYDINSKAAKILALSSGKIDNYECLADEEYVADEEILPTWPSQMIEQTKFT